MRNVTAKAYTERQAREDLGALLPMLDEIAQRCRGLRRRLRRLPGYSACVGESKRTGNVRFPRWAWYAEDTARELTEDLLGAAISRVKADLKTTDATLKATSLRQEKERRSKAARERREAQRAASLKRGRMRHVLAGAMREVSKDLDRIG